MLSRYPGRKLAHVDEYTELDSWQLTYSGFSILVNLACHFNLTLALVGGGSDGPPMVFRK